MSEEIRSYKEIPTLDDMIINNMETAGAINANLLAMQEALNRCDKTPSQMVYCKEKVEAHLKRVERLMPLFFIAKELK